MNRDKNILAKLPVGFLVFFFLMFILTGVNLYKYEKNLPTVTVGFPTCSNDYSGFDNRNNHFLVPISAVVVEGEQSFIWAVEENHTIYGTETRVKKVAVTVVCADDIYVTVVGDINERTSIVIDCAVALQNNDLVKIFL